MKSRSNIMLMFMAIVIAMAAMACGATAHIEKDDEPLIFQLQNLCMGKRER
jgi:hypothetical protein